MALAQISNHTTASQKQFAHLTLALASGKFAHPGELGHIWENLDSTFGDGVIENTTNIFWGDSMMQYLSVDCLNTNVLWWTII